MATVQIGKKETLELLDGEELIYAHPRISRKEGYAFIGIYLSLGSIAITTKRIALIHKKKGVQTINYADIVGAQTGADPQTDASCFSITMKEKTKVFGFIPVHIKHNLMLQASVGEAFQILGRELASGLKEGIIDLAEAAEHSHIQAKSQQEFDEQRARISADWNSLRTRAAESEAAAAKRGKPTPRDRRNLIVDLINAAMKVAG